MIIQRKAKRGGHLLSLLGMGGMRLPTDQNGVVDQHQVNTMVDALMQHGVNYYDSAFFYHNKQSEKALGEALRRYPRDSFYFATKLPIYMVKNEEDLDLLFDEQLQRSGMEYFDYYLLHALNPITATFIEKYNIIPWLEKKRSEGKIRFLGFSIHAPYETLIYVLDLFDWDFGQVQLNNMNFDVGEKIGAPLKKVNPTISYASYGYRFLMDMPDTSVILSGASNLEQVKDNIATFSNTTPLSKAEYAAIEDVKNTINRLQKVKCTGCGYCMPCPFGVDIPLNFKVWNNLSMFEGVDRVWASGFDYPTKKAATENCRNCGQCIQLCPQAIDIPSKLAQLTQEKTKIE